MHVNSSTRVEKACRVLCMILFQKIIRVVGKWLVEFSALDSNPPLVNTQQISTRLLCKRSLNAKRREKRTMWDMRRLTRFSTSSYFISCCSCLVTTPEISVCYNKQQKAAIHRPSYRDTFSTTQKKRTHGQPSH